MINLHVHDMKGRFGFYGWVQSLRFCILKGKARLKGVTGTYIIESQLKKQISRFMYFSWNKKGVKL